MSEPQHAPAVVPPAGYAMDDEDSTNRSTVSWKQRMIVASRRGSNVQASSSLDGSSRARGLAELSVTRHPRFLRAMNGVTGTMNGRQDANI